MKRYSYSVAILLLVVPTLNLFATEENASAGMAATETVIPPSSSLLIPVAQVPVATVREMPVATTGHYIVQPGDLLQISVWKEQDLQGEVMIRPDGGFSFPLVGEFMAKGKTIPELQREVAARVHKFVPDAVVTVAVKQPQGNRIYVMGKVNRPGEYVSNREVDVTQALSLAGGATPFATLNKIKILRRSDAGQRAIPFRYGDIEKGRNLEQNILLQGGDTVVVP